MKLYTQKRGSMLLATIGLMTFAASSAYSQFTVNITFDENCKGTFVNSTGFSSALPCSFTRDPGPGGLASVMLYDLLSPPGLVTGDLIVMENANAISDILRFDPTAGAGGGVFVYSDFSLTDPADALADIGLPTGRNTNVLSVPEVGPEGNNGITYTPTAGQPGFVAGSAGPVTYNFISDQAVPEPGTVALMVLGVATIWMRRRRVNR